MMIGIEDGSMKLDFQVESYISIHIFENNGLFMVRSLITDTLFEKSQNPIILTICTGTLRWSPGRNHLESGSGGSILGGVSVAALKSDSCMGDSHQSQGCRLVGDGDVIVFTISMIRKLLMVKSELEGEDYQEGKTKSLHKLCNYTPS